MPLNSMYKGRSILPSHVQPPRTSLEGQRAEQRKKERQAAQLEDAAQKERDLKAIVLHERAQHAEQAAQAGVAKTVANFNRRTQQSDENAARLEHGVENLRRRFRPTPEKPRFDPYAAIDEVMTKMKPPGEHIRRDRTNMTQEQRRVENQNDPYRKLGLQNPSAPSIVGSGLTGYGQ